MKIAVTRLAGKEKSDASRCGMPKAHAARAIEVMIDALVDALRSGDRGTIPGLGSF